MKNLNRYQNQTKELLNKNDEIIKQKTKSKLTKDKREKKRKKNRRKILNET